MAAACSLVRLALPRRLDSPALAANWKALTQITVKASRVAFWLCLMLYFQCAKQGPSGPAAAGKAKVVPSFSTIVGSSSSGEPFLTWAEFRVFYKLAIPQVPPTSRTQTQACVHTHTLKRTHTGTRFRAPRPHAVAPCHHRARCRRSSTGPGVLLRVVHLRAPDHGHGEHCRNTCGQCSQPVGGKLPIAASGLQDCRCTATIMWRCPF